MWVKGIPLHFVVDSNNQKNLISTEVNKILDLPTTPHPHRYNISWLGQGWGIHVTQQCLLPYGIKPFKYDVLCDVTPLEVCDVLLGQPYMWNRHVVYESQPHSVIVTSGGQLYQIPKIVRPTTVLQDRNIISHIGKFSLFIILYEGEHHVVEISTPSSKGLSSHKK